LFFAPSSSFFALVRFFEVVSRLCLVLARSACNCSCFGLTCMVKIKPASPPTRARITQILPIVAIVPPELSVYQLFDQCVAHLNKNFKPVYGNFRCSRDCL